MKQQSVGFIFSNLLLCSLSTAAMAQVNTPVNAVIPTNTQTLPQTVETPAAPVFHGSCTFEGQYASGCIEFIGGTWEATTMQSFCQEKSKPDLTPVVVSDQCPKVDYNSLCSTTLEDSSLGNMYVNNLPGFICNKYMNGVLTKRPDEGWPVTEVISPIPPVVIDPTLPVDPVVPVDPTLPVDPVTTPEVPAGPVFHGSCTFEGQYASGCIEFIGGTWDATKMQSYCQEKSKPDLTPVVVAEQCAKVDYNSLCATTLEDSSLGNMYVNNLPGFICKKYMSGVLTKRPAAGW